MNARSRWLIGLALLFVISAAVADDLVLERFTFDKESCLVFVPIAVNGTTYNFLVDTGATHTTIDLTLLPGRAKNIRQVNAIVGAAMLPEFNSPNMRFGESDLQKMIPIVHGFEFRACREAAGADFFGLVGMDFLANYVVQIDFDNGELTFLKKSRVRGVPFEISFNKNRIPTVVGNISCCGPQSFSIDSGDTMIHVTGTLRKQLCDQVLNRDYYHQVGTGRSESLTGPIATRMIQGGDLTFGELIVQTPIYGEASGNRLGVGFLRRFLVTFDFPNARMYLEKGRSFDHVDKINTSGLHWHYRDGKLIVNIIDEESPAATTDVRQGDEILAIGDHESNGRNHDEMVEAVFAARPLVIRIRRDGVEIEKTLTRDP